MQTTQKIRRVHSLMGAVLLLTALISYGEEESGALLVGAETNIVFGLRSDTPAPGDYNGDGIDECVILREERGRRGRRTSVWLRHTDAGEQEMFRTAAAGVPVQADYDGDGILDAAIYDPHKGVWTIRYSSTGEWADLRFGLRLRTLPVPGDYSGDGAAAPAFYLTLGRSGLWLMSRSFLGSRFWMWGITGRDLPIPGDYDGDGITDLAVYRSSSSHWFVLLSSTAEPWILNSGIRGADGITADFDGDGISDPAVVKNGVWYVFRSTLGPARFEFDDWRKGHEAWVAFDFDGDGIADPCWIGGNPLRWRIQLSGDRDDDGDGYTNMEEALRGTSPAHPDPSEPLDPYLDTDGDGMPDWWEIEHGLDPYTNDAHLDTDGDGVDNLTEYLQGRDPNKGAVPDTDNQIKLVVFTPLN